MRQLLFSVDKIFFVGNCTSSRLRIRLDPIRFLFLEPIHLFGRKYFFNERTSHPPAVGGLKKSAIRRGQYTLKPCFESVDLSFTRSLRAKPASFNNGVRQCLIDLGISQQLSTKVL